MAGAFNPLDNVRTSAIRPDHIDTAAGERRWFSDLLRTRPKAQDLNYLMALFRAAVDEWGIPDSEGDDTILVQLLAAAQTARRNFVRNPSFDIWQAGTSFSGVSSPYVADLWKVNSTAGRTYSRQAGFSGSRYSIRLQRNVGNTDTTALSVVQVVSPELASQLAGKTIVLSADIRSGADFSGSTANARIATGTGIDEPVNAGGNTTLTFPTGNVQLGLGGDVPATTAQRHVWTGYTVAADATELAFRISYNPVGTAGAADYLEATNIKLEIATKATAFEFEPIAISLASALRLYRKSFAEAQVPAQNIGVGTGEWTAPAPLAGANSENLGRIMFDPMKIAPTVTLFNPAAATAHVRDETAAANCTASAAQGITDRGFNVFCTGNASTAVGNLLGIHWVADSRAF